jgi:hypothetical protein
MENKINRKLSVNVSDELITQIDSIVKRHGPFAKRHAIHLLALRIGLIELLTNPERVNEALVISAPITSLNVNP